MAAEGGSVLLEQPRPTSVAAQAARVSRPTALGGRPEVWGGIECSVVRLADEWRDQVHETGHHARGTSDLDRVAGLGITTLRYPVLWERVVGRDPGWEWHDRQLSHARNRGLNVIAGLVHHGSGPAGTDLLDPQFGEKLAAFAGSAADRYGFITAWTPVNEPLTTARFSCLYGHWYPHLQDEGAFLRALVNQCRAILLAVRAIRTRCPDARFVHTEDIGRVFATRPLAQQARYENQRRWLSLDLLCGRLDASHPWHETMLRHGVSRRDLAELATGEAAPDQIGINHYATSDRFLDHRVSLYPARLRGGNGRQAYVDTEAVRVRFGEGETGWEPRLREVWERYRRPIAITEVHLGCRDTAHSLRWLMEAWVAATSLRRDGIPIEAVTAWALFGLVDWDSMLRERRGQLEPGVFDTGVSPPRPTRIAAAVEALARDGRFSDRCLEQPGWWRREDRFHEGAEV